MSARLIVTADDFGMSLEVNEAVEEAHRKGILTCASLVVAGEAAEDAVRRAKRLPELGVGLHLAVFGARASAAEPSLLAPDGVNLGESPVSTGSAPRARMATCQRARAKRSAMASPIPALAPVTTTVFLIRILLLVLGNARGVIGLPDGGAASCQMTTSEDGKREARRATRNAASGDSARKLLVF